MKIYLIELRRSPLLLCLPLLVLVDLAAVFGRSHYWIGVWPQASAAAQIPAIFFAPAFAGAAAWAVSRSLQRGVWEQRYAAARTSWHMEAVQFAATLTYGLLAYTLGAVAAAIVSVPTAGPGFLWPSYLLLGFSVITLCAALGHLVGRWSRSIFMAPVICALGCFVAIGAIGSPRGLGLFVLSGEPNVVVNTWPLVARISLATALLFAAIVLPDRQKRQRFRWPQTFGARVAASCAGFAVLVAFSSLIFAGPIRVDRAATDSPLCSTSSPRVCIWPEDRKYLPELTAMAERLDAVPQKWLNLPDTFYQSGLRPDPRYIPIDFSFSEGQLWFAAPNFAGVVIQRSITDKCEERSRVSAQKYSDAILQLDLWLEFRLMGSSKLSINSTLSDAQLSEPQRIVQASEGEQASWVDKQLKVIHNLPCQ